MTINEVKQKTGPIMERHGVAYAGVFGSVARGEDRPQSDVDIMVRLGRPMGMVEYMELIQSLEEILQKRVDLVTEQSLNKHVRPYVMPDLTTIYEKWPVYLEQILDATEKIRQFVTGMDQDAFLTDQKTQSAVIMQLALIGELAKRVSQTTRAAIKVPWREIAGFRDRAIHDYYQIDLQIAWGTILHDLEPLTKAVKAHLVG